jgi:hypothetical protein
LLISARPGLSAEKCNLLLKAVSFDGGQFRTLQFQFRTVGKFMTLIASKCQNTQQVSRAGLEQLQYQALTGIKFLHAPIMVRI